MNLICMNQKTKKNKTNYIINEMQLSFLCFLRCAFTFWIFVNPFVLWTQSRKPHALPLWPFRPLMHSGSSLHKHAFKCRGVCAGWKASARNGRAALHHSPRAIPAQQRECLWLRLRCTYRHRMALAVGGQRSRRLVAPCHSGSALPEAGSSGPVPSPREYNHLAPCVWVAPRPARGKSLREGEGEGERESRVCIFNALSQRNLSN